MKSTAFERFAGLCAMLAGVSGLLYAIAFVVIAQSAPAAGGLLSALFLTASGLLGAAALAGHVTRGRGEGLSK